MSAEEFEKVALVFLFFGLLFVVMVCCGRISYRFEQAISDENRPKLTQNHRRQNPTRPRPEELQRQQHLQQLIEEYVKVTETINKPRFLELSPEEQQKIRSSQVDATNKIEQFNPEIPELLQRLAKLENTSPPPYHLAIDMP